MSKAEEVQDKMCKFNKITVSIERTINLGNYENVKYKCEVEAEVREGPYLDDADRHETYNTALKFCKEKVGAEIDRLEAAKRKK